MWRDKVTNVSDHIFPGLSVYSQPESKAAILGTEVLSNLPLQIFIYFNIVFFPCWCAVYMFMVPLKYSNLQGLDQLILTVCLISVTTIECIRLYIGYIGNLNEQIPELAGFWLVSLLLQTPLQTFLLFSQNLKPSLIETLSQTVMNIFLLSELFWGFFALRHAAKHSVEIFHLAHFNSQVGKYE